MIEISNELFAAIMIIGFLVLPTLYILIECK